MASINNDSVVYSLGLSPDPIRFEPISAFTSVFFDEANGHIFTVRSGGTTRIVVKGPDQKTTFSFRMADKGDINSIKLSPDRKVLSIQRSSKSVEFVNFNKDLDCREYSQRCRGKMARILGFSWTNTNEIVFVTNQGIEYYQVLSKKRTLKMLKTYNVAVNWYLYHAESRLLLLSSGNLCNVMHIFQFRLGAVHKLPKFEVDLSSATETKKNVLLKSDVNLVTLYYKARIFVLRHQTRNTVSSGAEIDIYTLQRDRSPCKTNTLKLNMNGRFAVSVVDNIVIVHHQSSKKSMLYDIEMPGEYDGFLTQHNPLVPPLEMKPFLLKVPADPSYRITEVRQMSYELYSQNCAIFLPNIIIDPKLGYLWHLQLYPESLVNMLNPKPQVIDFLFLRQNSKPFVLKVCRGLLAYDKHVRLRLIGKIFDKFNNICKQQGDDAKAFTKSANASKASMIVEHAPSIDQDDMYANVFVGFENNNANYKFVVSVLLEYIRSLTQHQFCVQHSISELLINVLVLHKQFYQLQQLLQYNILNDSKPLAFLLLSLQNVYLPAYQLALDMLRRLQNSNEDVIKILLSQKHIMSALRFTRSCGTDDALSAPKYLFIAASTLDHALFYAVFKFFEQRNLRLRRSLQFPQGEQCAIYINYFENIFGRHSFKEFVPF